MAAQQAGGNRTDLPRGMRIRDRVTRAPPPLGAALGAHGVEPLGEAGGAAEIAATAAGALR